MLKLDERVAELGDRLDWAMSSGAATATVQFQAQLTRARKDFDRERNLTLARLIPDEVERMHAIADIAEGEGSWTEAGKARRAATDLEVELRRLKIEEEKVKAEDADPDALIDELCGVVTSDLSTEDAIRFYRALRKRVDFDLVVRDVDDDEVP